MAPNQKVVIISGLAGSGKSVALHALEDLAYYALDNLPIELFENFMDLAHEQPETYQRVALVMDLRDASFAEKYPLMFRKILQKNTQTEILFLEASDDALIRRFSETRRKHPLSSNIAQGIQEERKLLQDLKGLSQTIIDTTSMDPHHLKRRIKEQFGSAHQQSMQIRVISFGFKYGIPKNCDLLFDVRFLNNPHFVAELRDFTGLDAKVGEFISRDNRAAEFLKRTLDYLSFLIPHYSAEGKSYLSIGLGCTGGKHRSVYLAEKLGDAMKKQFADRYAVRVDHQDLRQNI